MASTIAGVGYDWAFEQTGKALEELIELLGQSTRWEAGVCCSARQARR